MNTRRLIGWCLLAAALPLGGSADTLPAGTTVTTDEHPDNPGIASWTFTSGYQSGANKVEYLLPKSIEPGRRYPVIYCLPVNAGTHGDWGHPLVVAREAGLADRFQAILVCPAYSALPWYGDNPGDPLFRHSSYLTEVVTPLVESRLPVIPGPAGRFLVGFSKSAHGALGLFLRHTDHFAKIAVFENYWGRPTAEQWEKWGFAACYGNRENYNAWDPQSLIDLHRRELSGGPTRIIVLTGGPRPRLGVEALVGQLRDRDIPLMYLTDDHWSHNWTCGWLPMAVAALVQPDVAPSSPPPP